MPNREELEGGCFVIEPAGLDMQQSACMHWSQVAGADDAARRLSLFYVELTSGTGPAITAGAGEAVLFLLEGSGQINISGRLLPVESRSGMHVRQGESFSLSCAGIGARWLIGICPRVKGLQTIPALAGNFDAAYPDRVVPAGDSEKQATGDRFYKLLVGPHSGSKEVTQFIGMIPRSRAPEHFHLYEEVICILSGSGRMWTGEKQAAVKPGSMIFLPRKQPHSLECTSENGMELVGMFYPAGSPATNYPVD